MEYVPNDYRHTSLRNAGVDVLINGTADACVIRGVRCRAVRPTKSRYLELTLEGVSGPVLVDGQTSMIFGTETISIREYFVRVLEADDLIDLIVGAGKPAEIKCLWIHIEHVGKPSDGRTFSQKDDGLFALRTKAGEKAERRVARHLAKNFGHRYEEATLQSPGRFCIYYVGKGIRKPDLVCNFCGLRVEVKKRNKDCLYRVSHSESRTFSSENSLEGWHCFVFPDYSLHFLPNSTISSAITAKHFVEGNDRYDAWIDIDSSKVNESEPPTCNGGGRIE